MNDASKGWRFCAVGNIVKEHSDGENVFYGTKAFNGGTKFYINDRRALEEFVNGRRDMYSYTISKEADENQFNRVCSIVEAQMAGYKKEKLLEDVDGTQIQIYITNGKRTKVVNDYEVDAVYIDTEILLEDMEEYRIKQQSPVWAGKCRSTFVNAECFFSCS